MATQKKRPSAPKATSPRGVFVFPKINEPDYKFKKDGEFALKLRVQRTAPGVQAFIDKLQPMHDTAIARADHAFRALPVKTRKGFETKGVTGPVVNPLFSVVFDEETEEPTGEIEFKFSLPASGEIKNGKNAGKTYVRRPGIFDAKGNPIVEPIEFHMLEAGETPKQFLGKRGPAIWGGSEGKVSVEVGVDAEGEPGYFVPATAAAGLSLRLLAVQLLKLVQGGSKDASGYGFGQEDDGYAYEGSSEEPADGEEPDGEPEDTSSEDDGSGDF